MVDVYKIQIYIQHSEGAWVYSANGTHSSASGRTEDRERAIEMIVSHAKEAGAGKVAIMKQQRQGELGTAPEDVTPIGLSLLRNGLEVIVESLRQAA